MQFWGFFLIQLHKILKACAVYKGCMYDSYEIVATWLESTRSRRIVVCMMSLWYTCAGSWEDDSWISTWWRHQMETFSALLAFCMGNSPVTGEFPAQRPVTRSFDVFFNPRFNKRLRKQWWGWWFFTPLRPLLRHSNEHDLISHHLTPLFFLQFTCSIPNTLICSFYERWLRPADNILCICTNINQFTIRAIYFYFPHHKVCGWLYWIVEVTWSVSKKRESHGELWWPAVYLGQDTA